MILQLSTDVATLSSFSDNPLARAVVISLFSWRRADDDDEVDGDRMGWWGDTYADQDGDLTGSRLWLLLRSKVTDEAVQQAREYAEEALQWMLDDGVASRVIVEAERFAGGRDRIDMKVTVIKPDGSGVSIRFQDVWGKL